MNSSDWSAVFLLLSLVIFVVNAFYQKRNSFSNATSGFVLWQAIDNWLDFAVYPAVLDHFGLEFGFVIMFFATLIGNTCYIIINNNTKTDWTLMDKLVNLSYVKRIIGWKFFGVNFGRGLIFLFFAIKFDSFYALNFLFGKKTDLTKIKVWVLFLLTHLTCNVAWTFLWETILISWKKIFFFVGY